MEGTERERERLAASPPARPAAPSSPHVVVDVVDDEETVTTPAANSAVPRLRPPPPPPTPTPTTKPTSEDSTTPTPPPKSEGKASTTASTTASTPTAVSSVPRLPTPTPTPTGKQTPPPPPPPPSPRTPTGKPEEKASTTASTPASGSVKPDGKAPPPPPPPNPNPSYNVSTPHPPPPPPPPPPPRTGPTTPTASKVSSSSAGNPVPHTSPTRSDLSEDDDTEFRLRCIALTNQEQAVKEKIKKAKKLRNENEITRRTEEIKLMQWREELDRREAILATKEQEVRAAQMLDREKKLKSREDALTVPLLEQEGQSKQNKDDAVWDKRQNIMAISLACGLSVLISMQPLLPPDYLKWIVGSFAIVWALATIALPAGLFGTSRFEKDFSRHMSRITFMSFAMFVIYVLYILSQSPAPRSSGLAPSPPPQLLESWVVPSMSHNAIFYILLGFATLIGHIGLWISGCVSGGDKDP